MIPGANTGTLAIAGLYDTIAKTYIWLKVIDVQTNELSIISALALNFNEDTLVLAGTGLSARTSYYFFVEPMTGSQKYPMFKAYHEQDFHMLTSESILIAGSSRLYAVGISMQWTAAFTFECNNIG